MTKTRKILAGLTAATLSGVVYTGAAPASGSSPAQPVVVGHDVPAATAPSSAERKLSEIVLAAQKKNLTSTQLDRLLKQRGYTVVSTGAPSVAAARTSSGSVKLYPPKLLHDKGKKFLWIAAYSWTNTSYSKDMDASCSAYSRCKLPGRDGFAISFSRKLNMTGYWATFGGRTGAGKRILDPWDRSRFGVAYKMQDIVDREASPDDLNMYYGNIAVSITGRPCGATSAWSKYAHTWDSQPLTGVTIGVAGAINYTFGDGGHHWQKASQPGNSRRKC